MGRAIEFRILECKRCGYKWCPRVENPVMCPNCRSPYWDRERGHIIRRDEVGAKLSDVGGKR